MSRPRTGFSERIGEEGHRPPVASRLRRGTATRSCGFLHGRTGACAARGADRQRYALAHPAADALASSGDDAVAILLPDVRRAFIHSKE